MKHCDHSKQHKCSSSVTLNLIKKYMKMKSKKVHLPPCPHLKILEVSVDTITPE